MSIFVDIYYILNNGEQYASFLFRGPSLSSSARAARIVSLESRVKSSTAALSAISSQLQEAGRGHDPKSVGRWKTLHALGDAKDLLQHLFSIAIEAR